MEWIGPTDAAYDERRALFNAMINKRPRLIAACKTPADIRAALDLSRQDGLAVAVRSAGHSVAGQSTNDDGLVIDVRGMTDIAIDPAARTARVGGGCTWADFDAAAQEHGLATTGGRVSTTGVAGLTLGGGSGWLERKHGLACDNLLAVELVTADGRAIRADDTQHQDLLWASKGGGGNFGVVTALEFALHPVGPTILGGSHGLARRCRRPSGQGLPGLGRRRPRRARLRPGHAHWSAGGVHSGPPAEPAHGCDRGHVVRRRSRKAPRSSR